MGRNLRQTQQLAWCFFRAQMYVATLIERDLNRLFFARLLCRLTACTEAASLEAEPYNDTSNILLGNARCC